MQRTITRSLTMLTVLGSVLAPRHRHPADHRVGDDSRRLGKGGRG